MSYQKMMELLPIDVHYLSDLVRLLLAAFLCGLIGLERESKKKPVGFKTCLVISVSSCLLTLISIESSLLYNSLSDNIRTDPMRLAAQIISGVGFIGAGVILQRSDQLIFGLTTAAIIWCSAGIGIACGAGFYFLAIFTTVLILLAIRYGSLLSKFSNRLSKLRSVDARIVVTGSEQIEYLLDGLRSEGFNIDSMNVVDDKKNRVSVVIRIKVKSQVDIFSLYNVLKKYECVYAVSLNY
ncbi:MgtC/SapB family protein [Serratia entomophila]|uniref:MgtC/SapB family protein n=1 Tax=Serratia entomophila TaxID=42906 RepID=UPI00217BF960|nr:MgtC/SapB family protein [Serratia entomophila]CAI1057543.1 putative Mg(2+) transport ATPase [Serratia entomophila]CAI1789905.1 putative Mg(2+) transport ATPase [Serratia entomophila]CAI1830582.1 putative Mg(2+) transport ATPase [Serratia entomophila]CAI1843664.1 putative Mg(2+) transport ATPase [Serratia entomophila]CAI1913720.1 putative Mg(2+) transport ATPase [Serratia entomophila]